MEAEPIRCPICDVPMGEYCCMTCGLTWDHVPLEDEEEEPSLTHYEIEQTLYKDRGKVVLLTDGCWATRGAIEKHSWHKPKTFAMKEGARLWIDTHDYRQCEIVKVVT